VHALVPRVAAVVLVLSFVAWFVLSLVIVVGRARYDRLRGDSSPDTLGPREARTLVRRAGRTARTERGTWRRVGALRRLVRANHRAAPALLHAGLADPDPGVAAATVRVLGDLGNDWAIDLLIDALCEGHVPRSRVAAQLDRLAPRPGERLLPLLRDPDPAVRFWGATLLAGYPELGESSLVMLTHDRDANVRAAAVETLGTRSGDAAESAALAAIEDPAWFVRVHAARSAGQLLGATAAPTIVRLLADTRWWVRTAAKDALRGNDQDAFARNGAAEVLQDIGFVDALLLERPDSPLLERIYAAGGERMREAARQRAEGRGEEEAVRAA
jgi:hypothetical protein